LNLEALLRLFEMDTQNMSSNLESVTVNESSFQNQDILSRAMSITWSFLFQNHLY